jgi:phosphatidylserine/phosphatidylglycerophosphate/cardiolipin synthase-like enzyme
MTIKSLIIATVGLFSPFVWSQTTIKEAGVISKYFDTAIEINWENDKLLYDNVKAFDAFTQEELKIQKNMSSGSLLINALYAGQIIKLEYLEVNDKATPKRLFLAAKSMSTGVINVYFNHPVDTTVATIQNAVNLGNTLDDKLITLINACVATLDIAIYNSYSPSAIAGIAGAINTAFARGVQVRVIYDGSTSSTMIPLLNTSIPRLASPVGLPYGIMHNKFVIFDANNTDANVPLLWTGSTNWTSAQINGPDTNSAITIQDQALALGYKLEFEEMWGSSTMAPDVVNSKFGPNKTNNTPHNYVIGGKVIENYFSPTDGVNDKVVNTINSASTDIDIATMIVTRNDIATAIVNKYNSGIANINLLVDSQIPTGNQFPTIQGGIAPNHAVIYKTTAIMHHKFVVVDNADPSSDPQVLVGSHNWTSSAETKNDENTLIVHDANIANQYYQAFAYLYKSSSGVLSINLNELSQNDLSFYPNPTSGIIRLNDNGKDLDDLTVAIFDAVGRKIITHYNTNANENIDISNYANGLYVIQLSKDNQFKNYKILKN